MTTERSERHPELAGSLADCAEAIGRPLLEYLLGDPGLALTLAGDAHRVRVLDQVHEVVNESAARAKSPSALRSSLRQQLLTFREGLPRAREWRTALGLATAGERTGDELSDLLTDIAEHCFPALLAKYETLADEPDFAPISTIAWSHPRFLDAAAALVSALELPTDLGAVKQPHEATFEAVWPPHSAGPIQAVALVPAVVQYALLLMVLDEARDEHALRVYVERSLETARGLAAGRPTDLPRVTVLRRVTVEHGSELPRSPVRLVWAEPLACFVLCQIPRGAIAAVHWSPSRLDVVRPDQLRPGETLEAARTRRWAHRRKAIDEAVADRRHIADRVRVALMLCSADDETATPDVAGEATLAPLPLLAQSMVRFDPDEPLAVLSHARALAFGEHLRLLLELPRGMDYGFERLLEGLTHSPGPVDSLVNAVLFWEALLGARSETTFRVCGAMARLLEPGDYDAARRLYHELSAIYDVRSRAVHGESGGVWIETHRMARRAIDIDRAILLAVLARDDLRRAQDAGERSLRVLLG